MKTRFCFALLFSLLHVLSIAQPINDECSGAIPLLVDYNLIYHPVDLSLSSTSSFSGATNFEIQATNPLFFTGRDVWYSFNSATFNRVQSKHDIYSSCGVKLAAEFGVNFTLQPHTEYIIAIREFVYLNVLFPESSGVQLIFSGQSANSTCENAQTIPPQTGSYLIDSSALYINSSPYASYPMVYSVQPTEKIIANVQWGTSCSGRYDSDIFEYKTKDLLEANETYYLTLSGTEPQELVFFDFPLDNSSCLATDTVSTIIHNSNFHDDSGAGPMNGNGLPTSYHTIFSGESGIVRLQSSFKIYENCSAMAIDPVATGSNIFNLSPNQYYIVAVASEQNEYVAVTYLESLFANNDCASPLQIETDGAANEITFDPAAGTASRSSFIDPADPSATAPDRWYQVNNSSALLEFDLSNERIQYQVYKQVADCTLATLVGDAIAQDGVYSVPAEPFLLRAYTLSTAAAPSANLSLSPVAGESLANNDECSGALSLLLSNPYQLGNMLDATPSTQPSTAANNEVRDLWFAFTTVDDKNIFLAGDVNVELYKGSCNSLALVDSDLRDNKVKLSAGTTYYFRVFYTPNSGVFRINETSATISSCAEATLLSSTQPRARLEAGVGYEEMAVLNSCQTEDRANAIWATFAGTQEIQSIALIDGGVKTIYSGTCGSLTEVLCTDSRDTLIALIPGTTYFMLHEYEEYMLYTLSGDIPAEDECSGALSLIMADTLKRLQVDYSPLSTSNPGSGSEDYWVSFTAPGSGSIYLEQDNVWTGGIFTIYESCGSSSPFFREASSSYSSIVNDLNPGSTYYLSLNNPEGDVYYQNLPATPNQDCNSAASITSFDCTNNITGHSYFSALWYSLIMPASGTIHINAQEDLDYSLYTGSCTDLQSLETVYNNIVAPVGSTVYLKIEEDQLFDFCLEEAVLLVENAFCSNAEVLAPVSTSDCTPYEFEFSPLTMIDIPNTFEGLEQFEVWYEIEVQYEVITVSLSNLFTNNVRTSLVKLYTECAGDGIVISNVERSIENLTVGNSIYIQVTSTPDDLRSGCRQTFSPFSEAENYSACRRDAILSSSLSFELCINGLQSPAANDECMNAQPINLSTSSCNQSIAGDTESAYDRTYNCEAGTRELFYSFSTNEEKNIIAAVLNSSIPMYISVRSFACTGIELACGIDSVIFVTMPDSTYYLAVSPVFSTENSTFDFCLSEYEPPTGGEGFVGIGVASPLQPLQVDGAISIGAKGILIPGSIRYTGLDFEGYTGTGWKSLTSGGGIVSASASSTSNLAIGDNLGNHIANRAMDLADHRIRNLASPLSADDASTKEYVDNLAAALENDINDLSNYVYDLDIETASTGSNNAGSGAADNLGNHTASETINMVNNRISNLATPVANNDAVNKVYVDELIATLSVVNSSSNNNLNPANQGSNNSTPFIPGNNSAASDNLGNHVAEQPLDMSNERIDNLLTPTAPDQAANKFYVDQEIAALENTLEQFESTGNSDFELENIFIEQELGNNFKLNLETTESDFSISMNDFFSGFTLERPQVGFPYIYNNERNVAIGDQDPKEQLHIYNNVPMRIGGALSYFNFEYSGNDLSLSAAHNQSIDQHFLLDYTNATAQGTSFDFDLSNQRLGINKVNPSAHIHINSTGLSPFRIENNGVLKTVFGPDGNLGIGVPNPLNEIDVNGTVRITKNSSSGNPQLNLVEDANDFVRLNFTNNSGKNIVMATIPSATLSGSKINFNIEDAGDVLTIAGNDRIGINDNTPDYTLDVEAQGGANPLRVGTSSTANTYLKILANGDVGVGDDPTADLHLHHEEGSTRGFRLENKSGTGQYWRMFVDKGNGNLQFYNGSQTGYLGEFNYASGAYTTNSDRRLKGNISDLHFDWEKFMRLTPANYFFKSDENKRKQLGLIAQEVEKVYPEIVYKNEETGMYKMDYAGTGVIAIKAVQELKKENEALENKIENLAKELEELKKLIKGE